MKVSVTGLIRNLLLHRVMWGQHKVIGWGLDP